MFNRDSEERQAQVKEMMECPEFSQLPHMDLTGDATDKYHRLRQALARLPCAEEIPGSFRRDIYGFFSWDARLPSGLVVSAYGADDRTGFGRD